RAADVADGEQVSVLLGEEAGHLGRGDAGAAGGAHSAVEVVVLADAAGVERDVGDEAPGRRRVVVLITRPREMHALAAAASAVVVVARIGGSSALPAAFAVPGAIGVERERGAADADNVWIGRGIGDRGVCRIVEVAVIRSAAVAGGGHQRPALREHAVEDAVP